MGHAREISGLPLATPRSRPEGAGGGHPSSLVALCVSCRLFRRESENGAGAASRCHGGARPLSHLAIFLSDPQAFVYMRVYLAAENREVIMMNDTSATKCEISLFFSFFIKIPSFPSRIAVVYERRVSSVFTFILNAINAIFITFTYLKKIVNFIYFVCFAKVLVSLMALVA